MHIRKTGVHKMKGNETVMNKTQLNRLKKAVSNKAKKKIIAEVEKKVPKLPKKTGKTAMEVVRNRRKKQMKNTSKPRKQPTVDLMRRPSKFPWQRTTTGRRKKVKQCRMVDPYDYKIG